MLQKCSQVCKVLYFYLANNISHVVIFRKDIIYLDKGYDWACVNVLKTAVTSVNDIHISIFVCQINVAMIFEKRIINIAFLNQNLIHIHISNLLVVLG